MYLKLAETKYLQCHTVQALRSRERGGGGEGVSAPQSSLLMCPFLLMSPLNALFLKDGTKTIDENQQAKSRAS